jgi:prophage antirepressor-like protein
MSNIQIFNSPEFGQLTTAIINGKKHIEATPCAEALGYATARDAISRHCRYVVKHVVPHPQSPGKTIEKSFIPEGDVYRLIVRSHLPSAERFERWVFDEVLPSVVATGSYVLPTSFHRLQYEHELALDRIQNLEERLKGFEGGLGSFTLRDVALHLRKYPRHQA